MYDPSVDEQISKKTIPEIRKEAKKEFSVINKITQTKNINIGKVLYITFGVLVILILIVISFYLLIL